VDTTRPLGRPALTLLLLAMLVAVGAPAQAHASTASRQRGNERAAARRAVGDLGAVAMPPGSRQVETIPGRAGRALASGPFTLGTPATVSRHQLWIVPKEPRAAFRWIGRHLPRRYHAGGSGSGGGGPTGTVNYRIWERAGDRHLLGSMLTVTAVHDGHGRGAVRLESIATWLAPRPAAEHIPSGVTKIEMRILYVPLPEEGRVIAEEGAAPIPPANEGEIRSLAITDPRQVGRIVRLVDGLRVGQPGEIFCPGGEITQPGEALPGTVHLRFESASGKALAEAIQSEPAGPCEPMKFAVRGEWMSELEGGEK
jgi:hypothetical protein